jgi:hypothetical protein
MWKQPAALLVDKKSDSGYKLNPKGENFDYIGVGAQRYYLDKVDAMTPEQIKVLFMGEFGVTSHGKAIYRRQWDDDYHRAKAGLKPIKGMPILLGWDWGKGGESCIVGQQLPSGQLRILQEIVADNIGLEDFARNLVLPRLRKDYPKDEFKIESVGDPAGLASHGLSRNNLNYFDVLNNSRYGVFKDWFHTVPAKSNHIELRLNAVRHFLTTKTPTGGSMFQLDRSCTSLRSGFNAGYCYRRQQVSGEARYKDSPDKNQYSHPHDGLQYICLHAHPNLQALQKHTAFVTRETVDKLINY